MSASMIEGLDGLLHASRVPTSISALTGRAVLAALGMECAAGCQWILDIDPNQSVISGTGGSIGAGGDGANGGGGGASAMAGLHVSNNRIVDAKGQLVTIHGVNRSGSEYACAQGWGIFDGPTDAASVQAIRSWNANAVRIPLNEDCWLAINGAPSAYSGASYHEAIFDYVALLESAGMIAILDLHWNAPGMQMATGVQPMPDRDHSVLFWSQVAAAYKDHGDVIFEPITGPYPDNDNDTTAAWTCWRDGGVCSGVSFEAAGMQEIVNAIRNAGSPNLVLLGGVQHANTLSQWLAYKPTDPANNLAASWHVYNTTKCATASCYDTNVAPAAAQVPLVATELGEDDCAGGYISTLMDWLDSHSASYLAWTWNDWGTCTSLISDYSAVPNGAYGETYQNHLLSLP